MDMRRIVVAAAIVVIAGCLIAYVRFFGEDLQSDPVQNDAQTISVQVRNGDWVESLTERTRVVGVPSSEAANVKDSLERGEEVETSFELKTLGPLSMEDLERVVARLADSLLAANMELLERQTTLESVTGDGLSEYRLWLESMANVESYKAAVIEFANGRYFTVDKAYVFKALPLPSDYAYVGMTFTTSSGEQLFIAVPYSRSAWPAADRMFSEAKTVRNAEWSQFAQEFNALPLEERRRRIDLHKSAKSALRKWLGELSTNEIASLREQLLPGPFLINEVESSIRLPRL